MVRLFFKAIFWWLVINLHLAPAAALIGAVVWWREIPVNWDGGLLVISIIEAIIYIVCLCGEHYDADTSDTGYTIW